MISDDAVTRQPSGRAGDYHFDRVGPREVEDGLGRLPRGVVTDGNGARCGTHCDVPVDTFRQRAGEVPWPTRIV